MAISLYLKYESNSYSVRLIQHLPFIMYSFSDEPGSVNALKRFVNSTSTNGAISAAVML